MRYPRWLLLVVWNTLLTCGVFLNVRADVECHTNALCTKLNGSFVCQCQTGFFGDGYDCSVESSIPNTEEVSAMPAQQQVIIGSVVGAVALFLLAIAVLVYRLKWRKESKPMSRHASTVMGQIDLFMMEDQTDRALDCVSVRSSRFSIPSLHLSSLNVNWTRKEDSHL
ncbi:Nidogen-2 [Desmophyllum pertusum]|uniref:Nidogen-2 n=1 Tax=Desmophyllum pertusum TaxID=174260 RepID=A0A9W9ZMS3_9CNID|nr:Nidogen-2 [Desmophyllum pertusum]